MDNRSNTIAGWVLGAGIVLLGTSLVAGQYFAAERPENMGYPIEGVEEEGGGADAEPPIEVFLASGDASRGEGSFRKCAACHTIEQGGATGIGPNLWASMGAPIAHVAGFNYSDALRSKGGTWTWQAMSEWLKSPRAFAPGTKMTFAGLSDPQERADLMLYMNQMGSNLPIPAAPAAAEEMSPEQQAAEAGMANASGGMAEDQPVLNEAEATNRVGGEGSPETAGNSQQERPRQ